MGWSLNDGCHCGRVWFWYLILFFSHAGRQRTPPLNLCLTLGMGSVWRVWLFDSKRLCSGFGTIPWMYSYHRFTLNRKSWSTLCVSSQVGCKMGCRFCATGTMKRATNLTTSQILEQLVHARRIEPKIRNIVFMVRKEVHASLASVAPSPWL